MPRPPTDEPDWWLMTTPHGPARLRIRGNTELGILDHDCVEDQASWQVPARVVANGTGAGAGAESFTDAFFDEQAALLDTELGTLKRILETSS
ncbi:hypothetical protein [Streptomyces sp. A1136]|uniref:hypothetical protein n=1 Tax=Streptomyces sp. A1136 TaxID=2563102 RepID=UPI00109EBEB3|nr:hypothetical protein [Streptomyces sp. A1136]THA47114.1 hypothetical protein E6R62_32175 [Streptomyces sp. A1136]